MKLSVKKLSKKSLSLLIALIMVFSALPLTPPISADAAVTTKTVSINGFGTVCKEQSRSADGKITIVNDQEDKNFSVGYISFTGIRNLKDSSYKINNAVYTYQLYIANWTERKGITYYYPTKNNDKFVAEKNKNIMDIDYIYKNTVADHKEKAIDYFGLVSIGNTTYDSERGTLSRTVNVTEMLKYALANNLDTIQLVFLLTSYGGRGDQQNTGSGDSWTDAQITVNQNALSVNMMSNDEYVNTYIASRKTSYNVLDNSINNSRAYMSNIYSVDAWATSSDNSYYLENNKTTSDKLRFNAFNVGVALYTGQGDIRFPVVLEKVAVANSSSDYDVYQNIEYTALNNGGSPFRLGNDNNEWQYCNSTTDLTDATSGTGAGQVVTNFSNSTSASKDSYIADRNNINHAKNDKFSTPTTKTFKNYITYTGTGNTTTYCDKLLRPTFKYRADYAVFWYSYKVGDWGWHLTNVHNKEFTLNSNFSCYVINIKPLLDIVKSNDFTSNFSNIYNNSSKYNQSSLNDYYKVMADIVEFDLSKKRLTNENEINSVAREIKDLVDRYNSYKSPELNQCTVTFTRTSLVDFTQDDIIATVKIEPNTAIADNSDINMPALSSPVYDTTGLEGENKHWEYFWQNTSDSTRFTSSTVVNTNISVKEMRERKSCSIVNKGIEGDNVNLECSVCKNKSTLNASAYKAAVLAAQASIANSQAYSQDSRDALSSVLRDQDTAINKAKTQQEVDNCTSAIVSANQLKTENNPAGKLVYNQYSITVNYVDEKGAGLGTQEITNVNYGTIKEVTAETNFGNKSYVVYKWTRLTQDGDKLFGLNSTSVSVNVVGNLTYYVHLKSTQAASPNDTAVVTLNNKAGKPVDVGYVTTNEAQNVVVNGNSIKIGTDTTLTAPQYSFYSVKGFIVNNELITAESGKKSITVTENMTIIPLYSPTSYVDITRKSGETFTINGKNIDSYSARWDELITLETTGDVIWCTTTKDGSEVVLGQGKSFKFRANENIEIYTKQEVASLTPNSRVGYFGYDADLKKVTIVNNFFVPGGANEYVKAGVVVSTKAKTRDEMIAQYNAGSLKFEGGYDKFTADKNQIRITINRNGSGDFSMWALSYVIVDGTTYFADDVISYTYNSPSKTA